MNPMPAISHGDAPIVVGLDGTEASRAALRWAADEAIAHGVPLVAVHVLDPRGRRCAPYAGRGPRQALESEFTAVEDAALIEREIEESGLTHVKRVFEVGVPSQVLVRCAIGARMLVLGQADHHRRRDDDLTYQGPALGSIARSCVARATCPVVVVPVPARRQAPRDETPEPRQVPVAHPTPVEGARTVFPKHQLVPIAHG